MHTRRFGAFIIGMWLMGAVLIWFSTSQSLANVERIFNNPPPQVQKELNDMGSEIARQILRYQAAQYSRRVQETWEVIQLGILGALLATSVLTAHRSWIVVGATTAMILCVSAQLFQITPVMNGLSRAYDFLPAAVAQRERDSFMNYQTWHRVLEVLKLALALLVTGRLMFDFYDFGKLISPTQKSGKRRRVRRPSMSATPASAASAGTLGPVSPAATPVGTPPELD
ncbi:MAG: hypothetical protein H7039_00665 [Bryobacteraceae bacterium]|nr:hypothetical protein [Bryobacteraceae bacterium]